MTWTIELQEEGRGEQRHTVTCKHVQFFKSEDLAKYPSGFGRHKMPILRVLLKSDTGTIHRITWSNYSGDSLASANPGKFVYHWPDREQYPVIKKKRCRDRYDFWRPKERVPGDTKEFVVHAALEKWLGERCGVLVARQVMSAFAERLVEFLTDKKAKAA